MVGPLQIAQLARVAKARVGTARELEARWSSLPPEQQDALRTEWLAVEDALEAVRARLLAGPRGFAREFGAAYRGEEARPAQDTRSLVSVVRELHATSTALRARLDALDAGR